VMQMQLKLSARYRHIVDNYYSCAMMHMDKCYKTIIEEHYSIVCTLIVMSSLPLAMMTFTEGSSKP
jgi:hypothetical protein